MRPREKHLGQRPTRLLPARPRRKFENLGTVEGIPEANGIAGWSGGWPDGGGLARGPPGGGFSRHTRERNCGLNGDRRRDRSHPWQRDRL